jgi:hypothetical protein
MAFFKVSTTEEAIRESGTGLNFINKSGIYDVVIKTVSVVHNDKGARSLNFNVEYNGNDQVFYGLTLDNNDGTPNYKANIFNKLCLVLGIPVVDDAEPEVHMLGKDKVATELEVLTQFSGLPVKVKIQCVYSEYQGVLRESKEIRGFYRAEDGASGEEVFRGTEPKQYEKDLGTTKDILKDVTEEQVAAFLANRSKGGSAPASKPAGAKVAVNPFIRK